MQYIVIRQKMKIIAITGSIGCGKTFLSGIVRSLGYPVHDIDKWVKYLYLKPSFLEIIKKNFPETFDECGNFNKRTLRNLVFNDNRKLKILESIIHPFLKKKLLILIHRYAKKNIVMFLDVALLFEMHWDKYCYGVILADIDRSTQKLRVMRRDNIKEADFERIVSVQLDNEVKKRYCDAVVTTNKPANVLRAELSCLIKELVL